MRGQAKYGDREDRGPPDIRTHAGFVCDAKRNEAYRGPSIDAPWKIGGVKELSPLAAYPLFDLVWDILPDLMHIITGIWKRHIFKVFLGRRNPSKPKPRRTWTAAENELLMEVCHSFLQSVYILFTCCMCNTPSLYILNRSVHILTSCLHSVYTL